MRPIASPNSNRSRLSPTWMLWVYVLGMVLAEYISSSTGPGRYLSILVHAMLALSLLAHAVFSERRYANLYVTLSVAPMIRVLSLIMPIWLVNNTYSYALVLINLPLIVTCLVAVRQLGYSWRDVGLSWGFIPVQMLVALTGLLVGLIERRILQPPGLTTDLSPGSVWVPALMLLIFTGLIEELLFRGLMQKAAIDLLGARNGILLVSLIFGVFHFGWGSPLDVAYVGLVGLFFGWVVWRTGSILGVTLAHGFANIMWMIVLPIVWK